MIFEVGQRFERVYRVSEPVYDGFIQVFGDKNPLHTDEAFAVAKGFRGKVMHGNILNGFLSHFIGECLPVKNVIIHSQEIEYKHAVYLNDALKFEAMVAEIFESVNAVEFKFGFRNEALKPVSRGRIQIGMLP